MSSHVAAALHLHCGHSPSRLGRSQGPGLQEGEAHLWLHPLSSCRTLQNYVLHTTGNKKNQAMCNFPTHFMSLLAFPDCRESQANLGLAIGSPLLTLCMACTGRSFWTIWKGITSSARCSSQRATSNGQVGFFDPWSGNHAGTSPQSAADTSAARFTWMLSLPQPQPPLVGKQDCSDNWRDNLWGGRSAKQLVALRFYSLVL